MEDDATPTAGTRRPPKRPGWLASPAAVGLGLLTLILAWLWYDSRGQMSDLREEIVRRVRDSETDSRDARFGARQAQEAMRDTQAKLALLEQKLAESQNHQGALEALYQDLSRSRDEWVLAEIEQILTIASQQLQLAGNVQAALAALQMADARLARSERPQFIPLRKVFARDMERMKTAPYLDIAGPAAKLDQTIASVDSLPLAQDARPEAAAVTTREAEGFWGRLGAELLGELKQLVRIQKVDGADPALLSPSQAFFLRENLKLRLLNARLSLLARDEAAYRNDLRLAASWLERYFDTRSGTVAAVAGALKKLGARGGGGLPPANRGGPSGLRGFKAPAEGAARGLASLLAARAAQRLREFGRRDRWLERAKEGDGDWRFARLMTTAELLLEERRFDEARAVLRELNASGPRDVTTLLLLLRAEQGLANWDEVVRIAKSLEKLNAMPQEAIENIRVNAHVALFSRKAHDPKDLTRRWDEMPAPERAHPKVAAAAARAFIRLGDCRSAHRIIEDALERDWDGALALLYGECADEDALERLERAEKWLSE